MMNTHPIKCPKKLIEVALPLDAINAAARAEKAVPRRGHPQTLHYWWARRPLAAARSVIFAQLVNDPSWRWELEHPSEVPPGHLKASWAAKRKQLFALISDLATWENTNNEKLIAKAQAEIVKSWKETCELNKDHPKATTLFDPERLPSLHDPFAGGGAIPLEAQRLGLEAIASDLNPVAVLINKAMIEIPPRFAGQPPVHPQAASDPKDPSALNFSSINYGCEWTGALGLAEDVRRYGAWVREEAERRIGHFYPKVKVSPDMAHNRPDLKAYVGRELRVIAWLWARTVKSPNPAFSEVDVPLVSTFILAGRGDKVVSARPEVGDLTIRFKLELGKPSPELVPGTRAGGRGSFKCLMSGAPISAEYIRSEGQEGRIGKMLLAMMAEAPGGRVLLDPTSEQESSAEIPVPSWKPDIEFFQQALGFRVGAYGMSQWSHIYTNRQLTTLALTSDLINEVKQKVASDAKSVLASDGRPLSEGGCGAVAYGDAVATYLSCALSRLASYSNTICHWNIQGGSVGQIFARQAIPMSWDFIEINPLEKMSGNWEGGVEWIADVLEALPAGSQYGGHAIQLDAASQCHSGNHVVSTDPPYYDNIGYADLSDFFYVWLRRSLKPVFPSLFATLTVPKAEELVATPARHGGREKAEEFFLRGMTDAIRQIGANYNRTAPITIYYAFKQAETKSAGATHSTGWETFLAAVVSAGLQITATWPIRTEKQGRARANDSNALASSIVLACRRRRVDASTISRREFQRELNAVLPEALDEMTMGAGDDQSPVAPVDLSQAMIGPGMAVFSKYAAVLEADGTPMSVKTALQLINRFLAEDDFDADTQFCLRWFEQHGWNDGQYGEADVLARAKATSVGGVVDAGVVFSGGGKVRLRKWPEYPSDWNPSTDKRLPVWEALHQLIRAFKSDGESGSGKLLGAIKDKTEAIRQLAYRLYTLCERRGWAEDARAYNELVSSWSAIETAANALPDRVVMQPELDFRGTR